MAGTCGVITFGRVHPTIRPVSSRPNKGGSKLPESIGLDDTHSESAASAHSSALFRNAAEASAASTLLASSTMRTCTHACMAYSSPPLLTAVASLKLHACKYIPGVFLSFCCHIEPYVLSRLIHFMCTFSQDLLLYFRFSVVTFKKSRKKNTIGTWGAWHCSSHMVQL